MLHAGTKHIEINIYFVREKIRNKQVEVRHVPSFDQIAYALIKALSSSHFMLLRDKLRVESLSTLSLRGNVSCC